MLRLVRPAWLMLILVGWNCSVSLVDGARAAADNDPCGGLNTVTGNCAYEVAQASESSVGLLLEVRDDSTQQTVGPRVCSFEGAVVRCVTGLGVWSSYVSAWCRHLPDQPPADNPVWAGRTEGAIFECARPGFDGLPNPGELTWHWLPDAPGTEVDPEEMARRLLASIEFQSPEMGMFPKGDSLQHMGLVGWNMWLWAAPSSQLQWGPVTDSISESGITVTLTAEVDSMEWDMGDGTTISCGKGRAWSQQVTGGRNVPSPECGHVYSGDGRYTVTATSNWDVEWSGGGQSGSLPFTLSRDAAVVVGEMQSVNR